MKELKYEAKEGACITPCPYGQNKYIGSLGCENCSAYIEREYKKKLVTCKGDEMFNKEIIDKGIELNNEIVIKDKDRKDTKKVIAALRGEITKKNKRILKLERIMNDMADKIDEKAIIIQDMNRYYRKRNIFQRIFNKHYEK